MVMVVVIMIMVLVLVLVVEMLVLVAPVVLVRVLQLSPVAQVLQTPLAVLSTGARNPSAPDAAETNVK